MGSARRKIDSYNAFRGICAVGILFSHMSYLANAGNPFWKFFYENFMKYGSRCSSFFFIVSGFLLVYTWKDASFGKYIQGKLKRLWPLTFCVFILAFICSFVLNDTINGDMPVGSPLWILSVVLNLVPLKAFVPIETVFYSFHGPSWYISVLFVFYIVGYFIVRKMKKNPGQVHKFVGGSIALVYVIELIICVAVDITDCSDLRLYLTYVNPYFRIFGEGLFGVMLCEYMPQIQEKIKDWDKNTMEMIAVVIFLGFFEVNNFISSSIWSAWVWFIPVGFLLVAFNQDDGVVSRISKRKFWQFLGEVSFELYMTHAFVYEGIPVVLGVISTGLKNWIVYHAGTRFVITLFASVVFAQVVHMVFHSKKAIKG